MDKATATPEPIQESLLSKMMEKVKTSEKEERGDNEFLKPKKTIRIAVSGDVHITEIEQKIIDTRDFQRLRGIRQLGTVLYVYPTALHTRYDHSLGTLTLADQMLNSIKSNKHSTLQEKNIDEDQEILIRLYALLHDITHVPYGHTIEDELMLISRHDENPARLLRFLGPDSDIGKIIINNLGRGLYDRLMSIYIWKDGKSWEDRIKNSIDEPTKLEWKKLVCWANITSEDAFINDIVSNTVCADLLDYLKRDNYFCNLGDSMEYRFVNFLYIGKMQQDDKRRVFVRLWKKGKKVPRRDTLTDLARLLEARYLLAERVYFHHAKIIAGTMLGRAIQEVMGAGLLNEESLYNHTDDTLLYELSKSSVKLSETLAKALLKRDLYEIFQTYTWEDFVALQSHDRAESQLKYVINLTNPNSRRELENRISDYIGANRGDVLIYAPPREMNMKVAETKVIWDGVPTSLRKIDDKVIEPQLQQILTAHRMLWDIKIICNRSLTANQRKLLTSACKCHFCTDFDKKREQEELLLQEIIEDCLTTAKYQFEGDLAKYKQNLSQAATELAVAATDKKQMFQDQLASVIRNNFTKQVK